MVNCCGDFDAKPFSKLLILYAEILDSWFVFDFFEEFRETVAFHNISSKSAHSQKQSIQRSLYILLHIDIELRRTFSRNFIELLLLLHPLLIHGFAS